MRLGCDIKLGGILDSFPEKQITESLQALEQVSKRMFSVCGCG